jgi:low affinity Fe/Cu permease
MNCAQWYSSFSRSASRICGRSGTFVVAVAAIVVWAVTGPLFGFSDTWQLTVNTGTTIVTFLMVFLIQNTQSRDTEAIQVKLDELIRATHGARNMLLDVEDLDEGQLDALHEHYLALARQARDRRAARVHALEAAADEAQRAMAADVNAAT